MDQQIDKEIKNFLSDDDYIIINGIDELKNNLDSYNFNSIYISKGSVIRTENRAVKFLDTDYEHPIVLERGVKTLLINDDWYLDHQEEVQKLIEYICSNINLSAFNIISKELITSSVIDSLCLNENLEEVRLTSKDAKNGYLLNKEDYEKFKKSSIQKVGSFGVVDELKENFDPLIDYNNTLSLVGYYNYNDLQGLKNLTLNKEDISVLDLNNLKYLNNGTKLTIEYDSIESIVKITNKLKELNLKNDVVIELNDDEEKKEFNKFIFDTNFEYKNIYVYTDLETVSLYNYKRLEKILYEMIKPAESLSNFEKYIYAYNCVKNYKQYKENEEDKNQSRDLYKILENEYMVCVGYSRMFGDLLSKLNIPNMDLSLSVDVSYDAYDRKEETLEIEKESEFGGHARRYIHIVDSKYDINGFYISDPTWDNDLENDFYNHLALTEDEAKNTRRYTKINTFNERELFDVKSIQEFYQKLNFLLDRPEKFSTEKNDFEKIANKMKECYSTIQKLDESYAKEILEKYPFIDKGLFTHAWPKTIDEISDLIYDIGSYIVSQVNNEISGEKVFMAVKNVYKNVYGYEGKELEEKFSDMVQSNIKKQDVSFPIRYKEKDGHKEIVMNEQNKFNIELGEMFEDSIKKEENDSIKNNVI